MPAAIAFECEVSQRGIADFVKALARYQRETQRDMRDAVRSATIDLVKSLRKQTKKAPRLMPAKAFRFGKSDPQYLTTKAHGLMRRMVRKGFPNPDRLAQQKDLVFWQPVRTVYKRRTLKNGGIAESWKQQSEAQLIREARQQWGKIWNWGLAKQTWGWFMWRLFNLSDKGFINPRVNITHKHVGGGIQETREPLPDGTIDLQAPIRCEITIINRIRYMRRALPPGAIEIAVQKATNSINHKIDSGLKSRRFDS